MAERGGAMALTQLGEDERMFRDAVRQFAAEQIGPLVGGWMRRSRWMPG